MMRHAPRCSWAHTDLYIGCMMKAKTKDITVCPVEIATATWMTLEVSWVSLQKLNLISDKDFLKNPDIFQINKDYVLEALRGGGMQLSFATISIGQHKLQQHLYKPIQSATETCNTVSNPVHMPVSESWFTLAVISSCFLGIVLGRLSNML